MVTLTSAGEPSSGQGGLALLDRLSLLAIASLAISVQIQTTIEIGTTMVRVGASDVFAVLWAPLGALLLYRHMREIGAGIGLGLAVLLTLSVIVMGYGLSIGAVRLNTLESWPVVKFVGWLSLLYCAGLCLVIAFKLPSTAPRIFAFAYLVTLSGLLALHNTAFVLRADWIGSYAHRYQGLLDNPNAQGFAMLCGMAICLAGQRAIGKRIGRFGAEALAGFILAGVFHAGSLAAVGAVALMILAHWVYGRDTFFSTIRIVLFAVISFGAAQAARSIDDLPQRQRTAIHDYADKSIYLFKYSGITIWLTKPDAKPPSTADFSIKVRADSYVKAFVDWRYYPLFGTGIGTYLASQRAHADANRPALQIHNSALWLLSEMGMVGLTVFTALYIALAIRFRDAYAKLSEQCGDVSDVAYGALLVMFGWLVMSQAHEILYQRALWLILGTALGAVIGVAANRDKWPENRHSTKVFALRF